MLPGLIVVVTSINHHILAVASDLIVIIERKRGPIHPEDKKSG